VFEESSDTHFNLVWARVRRRVHDSQDAEELLQEAFFTLHSHILEHGSPDSIPGMLTAITDRKVSNHLRARMFTLLDVGLRAGAGSFGALAPFSRRAAGPGRRRCRCRRRQGGPPQSPSVWLMGDIEIQ
jgi:hypothetical protein